MSRSPEPSDDENPQGILENLRQPWKDGVQLRQIRESCRHFGIPSEEPCAIVRARLCLHVCGLTKTSIGEGVLESCVGALSQATRQVLHGSIEFMDSVGFARFPNAWVPNLRRWEVVRQFIFRLMSEHHIPIPAATRYTVFRGVEPPGNPSFELHECFEHLLHSPNKHERWVYIDQALAAFGIYPGHALFGSISKTLVKAFDDKVVFNRRVRGDCWREARVLNALGIGLQLDKDQAGKSTLKGTLQPWNIRIASPYELDFLIALWLGASLFFLTIQYTEKKTDSGAEYCEYRPYRGPDEV